MPKKTKFNTGRACRTGGSVVGLYKTDWEREKNNVIREFFKTFGCTPGAVIIFLYDQEDMMPEAERIHCILKGKSERQKEYLLHMLQEMTEGMDKLL